MFCRIENKKTLIPPQNPYNLPIITPIKTKNSAVQITTIYHMKVCWKNISYLALILLYKL